MLHRFWAFPWVEALFCWCGAIFCRGRAQALQEGGGDVRDRHGDHAVDGDQELPVFLDPPDNALRALERTLRHAHLFARLEVECPLVGAQEVVGDDVHIAAVGRRGDQDEHPHFLFRDGRRLGAVGAAVDHQFAEVALFKGLEGLEVGPDEEQRRGQLDLLPAGAAADGFLHGLQGLVGPHASLGQLIADRLDPVIEDFDGVPVFGHGGGG